MPQLLQYFNFVSHVMKALKYLLGLLLVSSCTEKPKKVSEGNSLTKPQVQSYADTPTRDPRSASRQFGQAIISGKIKPSDDERTVAWLDSLQSDNPDTRNFAFRVFKVVVLKSDGALSEALCAYIKDYLYSHPKEFLDNYKTLDKQEKAAIHESIAYEFYVSGTEYAKDLNEYFGNLQSRCKGCDEADSAILKDLKSKLEARIR